MTLQEIQKAVANDLSFSERRELVSFVAHFDAMPNEKDEEHGDFSSENLREVEEAWDQEISKRIQEIDDGTVKMIPISKILRDLDKPIPSRAL